MSVHMRSSISASKIRRSNQARQRLYREGKNPDTINDKESTQVTISEDLADGQTVNLDASLKLLGEEEPKLLLPNDIQQLQLLLLEQQKKKQMPMPMPRQEQESQRSPSPFNEVAVAKELKRRYQEGTGEKEQAGAGQMPEPSQDLKALQVRLKMPAAHADESAAPITKRQKRGTARPSRASQRSKSNTMNGCGSSSVPIEPAEVGHHHP